MNFSGRGEMIPNEKSYCEIDPAVVDRWGIPVLRFHFKWSDYEYDQVRHMQRTFRALIDEMGGTALSPMPSRERGYGIAPGGRIIHEVGRDADGALADHLGAERAVPGPRRAATCSWPTAARSSPTPTRT